MSGAAEGQMALRVLRVHRDALLHFREGLLAIATIHQNHSERGVAILLRRHQINGLTRCSLGLVHFAVQPQHPG